MILSWTSYHEVKVDDHEIKHAAAIVRQQMAQGIHEDTAIHNAINNLIAWWNENDYYTVTKEVCNQIKDAILEYINHNE